MGVAGQEWRLVNSRGGVINRAGWNFFFIEARCQRRPMIEAAR